MSHLSHSSLRRGVNYFRVGSFRVEPLVSRNYSGVPFLINSLIEAEDFDNGGEGVAYHDLDSANIFGFYRTDEAVDIEANASDSNGYNIGSSKAGEWVEYTVNVPSSGNYMLHARLAAKTYSGVFHIEFDGSDKTGPINTPVTGDWHVWQTVSVPVALNAGQQVMRVVMDTNGSTVVGNFDWFLIESTNIAISANVSCSSENIQTDQLCIKSIDGVIDGYPGDYTKEWATLGGGIGSWIKLDWGAASHTIGEIKLYDRPNSNDQILSATLEFSDTSQVSVGALPNDGTPLTVTFSPRAVTWVKLTIDSVKGTTQNVGLSELEVY